MGKFYPNLVEKSTVVEAKAITTVLMTHNKVHIQELSTTYDWVPAVTFADDNLNFDVIQLDSGVNGRLIKVGKAKNTTSGLTAIQIANQLDGISVLAPQEVAELKFTADVVVGSNVSISIISLAVPTSLDDIPERIDYSFQETIDEAGIVVLKIRNEGDVDYTIPSIEISIVELRK